MKVYLNGKLFADDQGLTSHTIEENYDFKSSVLSIGGYAGWNQGYKDANMFYDDIMVYGSALPESKIQDIVNQY